MGDLTTDIVAISSLKEMKVIIKSELESLVDGYVSLGYYLKKTRDTEMYKEEGYANIYEFAKAEYNLSKSNVSRYMAINDRFSVEGNSPELADEFRDFGSSKLSEMLTLTDEQLEVITPNATVKDIREFKKIEEDFGAVATSQQGINTEVEDSLTLTNTEEKESLFDLVDHYFKNEGRTQFRKAMGIVLSPDSNKEEQILYLFAPSKFKMIKMHGGNAILNADNIVIMRPGQERKIYSYQNLIMAIINMFKPQEIYSANELFFNYYGEDIEKPKPVPVKVEIKDVKEDFDPQDTTDSKEDIEESEDINEYEEEDEEDSFETIINTKDEPEIEKEETIGFKEDISILDEKSKYDQAADEALEELEEELEVGSDIVQQEDIQEDIQENEEFIAAEVVDEVEREYEIRIAPRWYQDIYAGIKTFILRKDDKDYQVGDILLLKEYTVAETGECVRLKIQYKLDHEIGLQEGYCILGI